LTGLVEVIQSCIIDYRRSLLGGGCWIVLMWWRASGNHEMFIGLEPMACIRWRPEENNLDAKKLGSPDNVNDNGTPLLKPVSINKRTLFYRFHF